MKVYRYLLILFCMLSSRVFADAKWCNGLITHAYLTGDGVLVIRGTWRMEHTAICNLNVALNGVSPEVCKSWLSMVMAAKLSGTEMTVYYSDVDSCETIPAYSS